MTLKDILTMHTIMNSGNIVYKDLLEKAIESARDGRVQCEQTYDLLTATLEQTNIFMLALYEALKDLEKHGLQCRWTHHHKLDFKHNLNEITVYISWQ